MREPTDIYLFTEVTDDLLPNESNHALIHSSEILSVLRLFGYTS